MYVIDQFVSCSSDKIFLEDVFNSYVLFLFKCIFGLGINIFDYQDGNEDQYFDKIEYFD